MDIKDLTPETATSLLRKVIQSKRSDVVGGYVHDRYRYTASVLVGQQTVLFQVFRHEHGSGIEIDGKIVHIDPDEAKKLQNEMTEIYKMGNRLVSVEDIIDSL